MEQPDKPPQQPDLPESSPAVKVTAVDESPAQPQHQVHPAVRPSVNPRQSLPATNARPAPSAVPPSLESKLSSLHTILAGAAQTRRQGITAVESVMADNVPPALEDHIKKFGDREMTVDEARKYYRCICEPFAVRFLKCSNEKLKFAMARFLWWNIQRLPEPKLPTTKTLVSLLVNQEEYDPAQHTIAELQERKYGKNPRVQTKGAISVDYLCNMLKIRPPSALQYDSCVSLLEIICSVTIPPLCTTDIAGVVFQSDLQILFRLYLIPSRVTSSEPPEVVDALREELYTRCEPQAIVCEHDFRIQWSDGAGEIIARPRCHVHPRRDGGSIVKSLFAGCTDRGLFERHVKRLFGVIHRMVDDREPKVKELAYTRFLDLLNSAQTEANFQSFLDCILQSAIIPNSDLVPQISSWICERSSVLNLVTIGKILRECGCVLNTDEFVLLGQKITRLIAVSKDPAVSATMLWVLWQMAPRVMGQQIISENALPSETRPIDNAFAGGAYSFETVRLIISNSDSILTSLPQGLSETKSSDTENWVQEALLVLVGVLSMPDRKSVV